MKYINIFMAILSVMILINCTMALSQNTNVNWSSFNMGFAQSSTSITTVKGIVGQNFIGRSQNASTQVITGFFADTSFRGAILAVNDPEELPRVYTLAQNYPNPFNPSSTVRYTLPVESRVTVTVYNVLGQLTAVLVDEVQHAGVQSVNWNAAGAASGIYFYRLHAVSIGSSGESFTQVRKMLLVK